MKGRRTRKSMQPPAPKALRALITRRHKIMTRLQEIESALRGAGSSEERKIELSRELRALHSELNKDILPALNRGSSKY